MCDIICLNTNSKFNEVLMKFRITHYSKQGSWFSNGGTLIITDNECIIKYLFWKVAKFDISKTLISRISDAIFAKGIKLDDGSKSIELYFFPKTAEKIYTVFDI